jgi:hypothetical protein
MSRTIAVEAQDNICNAASLDRRITAGLRLKTEPDGAAHASVDQVPAHSFTVYIIEQIEGLEGQLRITVEESEAVPQVQIDHRVRMHPCRRGIRGTNEMEQEGGRQGLKPGHTQTRIAFVSGGESQEGLKPQRFWSRDSGLGSFLVW